MSDRGARLEDMGKILKISKDTAPKIVQENLDMKKFRSKRVPSLFTVEQKQQLIDDPGRCLQLFTRDI